MSLLERLKSLQSDADSIASVADRKNRCERVLAACRKDERRLSTLIGETGWNSELGDSSSESRLYVYQIIDEMKYDILRAAEMRLAAESKLLRIKAEKKLALLNSCIVGDPMDAPVNL